MSIRKIPDYMSSHDKATYGSRVSVYVYVLLKYSE